MTDAPRPTRAVTPALPAIVMMAMVGFCTPSISQERCPELARLRVEADEALKKATGLAAQGRCSGYVHFSVAWAEIAKYAHDHIELCVISLSELSDIDKRHDEAVEEREDACGGRRRNPLLPEYNRLRKLQMPPEIRPHW